MGIVYALPDDPKVIDPMQQRRLDNLPYSYIRWEIRGYLSYFEKMKAPLDPTMKESTQLGHLYSAYVEECFQHALEIFSK